MSKRDGYPERERMFAMKFGMLLMRTNAAQTIGADACWLLMVVVLIEDATHYTLGVTFFTGQLLDALGFRKWERLNAARQRAVDAGWLHYDAPPNGSRKPGTYWVLVPGFAQNMPNLPKEAYPENGDGRPEPYPKKGDGLRQPSPRPSPRPSPEASPQPSPQPSPEPSPEKGEPPSLHPHNPASLQTQIPKARAQVGGKFVFPSLEEIQEFVTQKKLVINVAKFFNTYEATGWKTNRGQNVRDWKAQALKWHQEDLEGAKNGSSYGRRTAGDRRVPKTTDVYPPLRPPRPGY